MNFLNLWYLVEWVPLLGHLSFLWATEVFVHPGHPFHSVLVGLEVQVVLVPHTPIYFSDFSSIVVVLDLMVVVNHLLHHHLHYHHHHCHLLCHFSLGEAVYHPLLSHHHSHCHLHYHQVEELLLHLPVTEASPYLFPQMMGQFLHPHIWWLWWPSTTLNRLVRPSTIWPFSWWHSFSSPPSGGGDPPPLGAAATTLLFGVNLNLNRGLSSPAKANHCGSTSNSREVCELESSYSPLFG